MRGKANAQGGGGGGRGEPQQTLLRQSAQPAAGAGSWKGHCCTAGYEGGPT